MDSQSSRSMAKPLAWVQFAAGRSQSARNIMIFLAICLALQMTGFVMVLPLFARRFSDFGAGVEALGLNSMVHALTGTLAAPWVGTLADRFGRRPWVLGSLAACVLASSGYLFVNSAPAFILLSALAGAFTAGLFPAVMGMVADLAPEDRRAQWIGIVNGGASVGWIAGPLLGGLLYDRWDYGIPFTVSMVMAAVALGIAFFFVPETHQPLPGDVQPESRKFQIKNRTISLQGFRASLPRSLSAFLILLITSFAVLFAWAFIEPQFMFYAYDQLHWTSSQLGLAMSTYGVTLVLGQLALGRLSDRLGRKPMLVLGLILFSAQFIGLAFFREALWIIFSFTLAGLGNALYDPALSAYLLDITPAEHKARMMGIKSTAGSLGSMSGPALVILFTPHVSPQGVFLIAALLVVFPTLVAGLGLKASQPV